MQYAERNTDFYIETGAHNPDSIRVINTDLSLLLIILLIGILIIILILLVG